MKKEWATKIKTNAIKNATTEYLTKWLADNQNIYEQTVKNQEFNGYLKNKPIQDKKTGKYIKPQMYIKVYEMVKQEIENRHNETMAKCDKMRQEYQQNDAPGAVVKNPTPNMAEKTEPDTPKTAKTNVKKVLHKNRTKTIDKTKKNNYITNTIAGQSRKTKTTTKKRSTMTNNNLTKNSLTKKQLAAFETVYHHIWRTISNTIPMHNKKMRSAGFEQARIETIKLLKKIY
jgi:hypothetical protein